MIVLVRWSVALAGILVLGTGCDRLGTGPLERLPLEAGLRDAQMLAVGNNDYVRGFPLPGEEPRLETPQPLTLDGRYILEFVPIAEAVGGTLRASLSDDVDEILLSELMVTPIRSLGFDFERRSKMLGTPVRIDLGPYRGRSVKLIWTYSGPSDSGAAIARVRLRRVERGKGDRPDVLLVCSDTHRVDFATGEAGRALMPRLDALAARAVVYRRAYSPASWTLPSITSTLTGLLPRRHLTGRRSERGDTDALPPPGHLLFKGQLLSNYPAALETVTERLRRRGYTTVLVSGNWFHFGSGLFADGQDLALGGDRWKSLVVAEESGLDRNRDPGNFYDDGRALNHKALSILREIPREDPLFMIVHYMDVHDWLLAAAKRADIPGYVPQREEGIRAYADQVRRTDALLGALLDLWESRRGLEPSLIVFYADHGEHLYEPGGLLLHGQTMQEALLRVPLVVKFPESRGIDPHASDRAVSLVDLAPTILEVAGIEAEAANLDGVSLLDENVDPKASLRTFFADYQLFEDELSSVRRGPFKLVINHTRGTETLVDLREPSDAPHGELGQTRDDAEARHALREAFDAYVLESDQRTRGLTSRRVVDPGEAEEQLRALGYLN